MFWVKQHLHLLCVLALVETILLAKAFPVIPLTVSDYSCRYRSRDSCHVLFSASGSSKSKTKSTATSTNKELVSPATIQFNNKLNSMARKFDKGSSAEKVESLLRETIKNVEMGVS